MSQKRFKRVDLCKHSLEPPKLKQNVSHRFSIPLHGYSEWPKQVYQNLTHKSPKIENSCYRP